VIEIGSGQRIVPGAGHSQVNIARTFHAATVSEWPSVKAIFPAFDYGVVGMALGLASARRSGAVGFITDQVGAPATISPVAAPIGIARTVT
jgi:hypothetical protein